MDRIRVYFASGPHQDLSLTGYVDLDPERPERILGLSEHPILDVGARGAFDEHGIMTASVVTDDDAIQSLLSSRGSGHSGSLAKLRRVECLL